MGGQTDIVVQSGVSIPAKHGGTYFSAVYGSKIWSLIDPKTVKKIAPPCLAGLDEPYFSATGNSISILCWQHDCHQPLPATNSLIVQWSAKQTKKLHKRHPKWTRPLKQAKQGQPTMKERFTQFFSVQQRIWEKYFFKFWWLGITWSRCFALLGSFLRTRSKENPLQRQRFYPQRFSATSHACKKLMIWHWRNQEFFSSKILQATEKKNIFPYLCESVVTFC